MAEHRRSANWVKVLQGVGRPSPMRSKKVIAEVLVEEGADALGPKIGDDKLASPREDDGVRKDNFSGVDATLQIA